MYYLVGPEVLWTELMRSPTGRSKQGKFKSLILLACMPALLMEARQSLDPDAKESTISRTFQQSL